MCVCPTTVTKDEKFMNLRGIGEIWKELKVERERNDINKRPMYETLKTNFTIVFKNISYTSRTQKEDK